MPNSVKADWILVIVVLWWSKKWILGQEVRVEARHSDSDQHVSGISESGDSFVLCHVWGFFAHRCSQGILGLTLRQRMESGRSWDLQAGLCGDSSSCTALPLSLPLSPSLSRCLSLEYTCSDNLLHDTSWYERQWIVLLWENHQQCGLSSSSKREWWRRTSDAGHKAGVNSEIAQWRRLNARSSPET